MNISNKFILTVFVALVALLGTCTAFVTKNNLALQSKIPLSTTTLEMTVLNYNGKKKDFREGSPLSKACQGLGIRPRYSCKKGDCNTCALTVGGKRMKPCVGKVPPAPRLKSLQQQGLQIK